LLFHKNKFWFKPNYQEKAGEFESKAGEFEIL